MTDREKLIALYDKAIQYAGGICADHGCDTCRYGECEGDCYEAAKFDYLLANGVVVREKGEWIKQEGTWRMMESGESVNIHLCSCCGGYFQNAPYNFCPACGADMRKGEKG